MKKILIRTGITGIVITLIFVAAIKIDANQYNKNYEIVNASYVEEAPEPFKSVFENSIQSHLTYNDQRKFESLVQIYSVKYQLDARIPYLFGAVESDFKLLAKNRHSNATGIFQITPICLKEYNNYHIRKFVMNDLYDMETSFEVSMWYIHRLVHHYKIPYQFRDLWYAYNAGPIAYKNNKRWAEARYNKVYPIVMTAFVDTEYDTKSR